MKGALYTLNGYEKGRTLHFTQTNSLDYEKGL